MRNEEAMKELDNLGEKIETLIREYCEKSEYWEMRSGKLWDWFFDFAGEIPGATLHIDVDYSPYIEADENLD